MSDDDAERPVHDPTGLDLAYVIAQQTASTRAVLPPVPEPRPLRRRTRPEGEQRSGAHPDERDPQLVGDVLRQVSARRGWRTQLSLATVLRGWVSLVGEANAQHSKPVHFADGVLHVACDSTAWATGMRYTASQLVARLNAELGEASVTRVDIRGPNAPSWKKGRLSVRDGRGPRDTYG